MSLGVLALGTMGGISAFLLLNRYAANLRNMSVARALCQERIEQALTLPFRAPTSTLSGTMPMAPNADAATKASGADPRDPRTSQQLERQRRALISASAPSKLLPKPFPSPRNRKTSTVSNSANITYTRTTTIAPASLYYATGSGTTTTSLNILQFTVTVVYVFRGQTYSASMNTLRGPD